MTFDEATIRKKELDEINKLDSDNLKSFDEVHGGATKNGLVPDHIREMAERKELKMKYDISFRELRNFNQWFVKTYRKKNRKKE